MLDTILSMFGTIFNNIATWTTRLFNSIPGSVYIILAGFLMYLLAKKLLMPLIGSAGSDIVDARSNYKFKQNYGMSRKNYEHARTKSSVDKIKNRK